MSDTYIEDTQIYLLISQKEKRVRGFSDLNKTFTFAFTSQEKAKAFLKSAKATGILTDVDLFYRIAVGEYFQWQKEGKATGDLTIDPDPGMVEHPAFGYNRFQNN